MVRSRNKINLETEDDIGSSYIVRWNCHKRKLVAHHWEVKSVCHLFIRNRAWCKTLLNHRIKIYTVQKSCHYKTSAFIFCGNDSEDNENKTGKLLNVLNALWTYERFFTYIWNSNSVIFKFFLLLSSFVPDWHVGFYWIIFTVISL